MTPYRTHPVGLYLAGAFLEGLAANETSQFGEDGLLAGCLEKFGASNRWCFEVGANDGLFFSNTHRLRCEGWDSVLIESYGPAFEKLIHLRSEATRCVHETIDGTSLDRILGSYAAPTDLDLGVIDIDGQDYWAWRGMQEYLPRLMLVEFDYGSDEKEDWVPEVGAAGQASLKAIERLGIEKGYTPLAKTLVNLLFVRTDVLNASS